MRAGTKAQLKQMFDARNVIQFAEFYPVGHRSTNYHKFFNVSEPYTIRFKSGYEPYVLVSRKLVPWYDERFRGYGWDKVRRRVRRAAMGLTKPGKPRALPVRKLLEHRARRGLGLGQACGTGRVPQQLCQAALEGFQRHCQA